MKTSPVKLNSLLSCFTGTELKLGFGTSVGNRCLRLQCSAVHWHSPSTSGQSARCGEGIGESVALRRTRNTNGYARFTCSMLLSSFLGLFQARVYPMYWLACIKHLTFLARSHKLDYPKDDTACPFPSVGSWDVPSALVTSLGCSLGCHCGTCI